jgi:hypothetical protein
MTPAPSSEVCGRCGHDHNGAIRMDYGRCCYCECPAYVPASEGK